jgi:NADPH:quinone reductase-like Zn-dependent oxidoreductase
MYSPAFHHFQATAVCAMDVAMRRSATSEDDIPFPFVLGSNFIGIVHRCSPQAELVGITPGTRVAAIVKWGASSKYVSSPVENLVVVPKTLDAADMACLLSTYLPAFQALHHGRARPYRYTDTCLKGRRILLTGGATLEVQALVRLARLAGATEIYVVAPQEHFSVLNKLQVTVLGGHPDEWLPLVRNRMHVVIDFAFPRNFSAVCDSLARRGRLVCSSPITNSTEKGWMSELDSIYEYSRLSMMKRATIFDIVENVQTYNGEVKEDLSFLLKMLSTRRIRPHIDRFIKVKDVGTAHEEMQTTALTGAIVCEPWNE